MLKRRIGSGTPNAGGDVAPDQVQQLFDSISELRNEMVSKKEYESNKAKSDERLDTLELQMKRLGREVQDLFSLEKIGQAPTTAGSNGANVDVMRMIEELQDQMELKHSAAEANKQNEDHQARIAKLTDDFANLGAVVTDSDIAKWNGAVIKSTSHEKDIEKMQKELSVINADFFKQEIKNLNVLILQMTPKVDHEKLIAEVNRQKN